MRKTRPRGVWLVLIYQLFNALLVVVFFRFRSFFPEHAAAKAYHEHLRAFDYVLVQIIGLVWWTGIISLFFLRKLAVPLLALAIGLSLANAIRISLTSNWLEALEQGGRNVYAAFVIIDLAILMYAVRLERKNLLD